MIRNLFEAVALIKAAPEKLKNFKELLDYARNIYKETTGVFPDGIDFPYFLTSFVLSFLSSMP